MGCAESKLENEDTVRRGKERRRLIKEALYARHHLAVAHSDYRRSLRAVGSALATFASGEPLSVSHDAPSVLVRAPSVAVASNPKPPTFVPPPHPFRAAAASSVRSPPPPQIIEPQPPPQPPLVLRKKAIKVPHILSESSFTSSPPPNRDFIHGAKSTYSSTASQASSAWNWDHIRPPPSPPDSEYFDQLQKEKNAAARINHNNLDKDRHTGTDSDDKFSIHTLQYQNPLGSRQAGDQESKYSSFSLHSGSSYAKNGTRQGAEMAQKPDQNLDSCGSEEEEIECSECGDYDCYSTASSSSDDDELEALKSRSDYRAVKPTATLPTSKANASVNVNSDSSGKPDKLSTKNDDNSSAGWEHGDKEKDSDQRIVARHKDFAEIAAALNEYFGKASSAGDQLSEILEIGNLQFSKSFKQLRKTVYHSTGILSSLSSRWTSKPPLAVKYRFESSSIPQSGGSRGLSSTLEELLAWEQKLYHEVKAREQVKIKHEKKLSSLQSLDYRGAKDAKLDKTKASINKLQSLIVVTSQAVSSTSSTIMALRDSNLVPQLVELCHGFMYMWRSMQRIHEAQSDIVQQVQGLVHDSNKGVTTSDLHRQATRDLEAAASAWHSSFCSLIKFQRDLIHALHGWFKLTLVPVNSDTELASRNSDAMFTFYEEWKQVLDRAPDTVASGSIKSLVNVVHSIITRQTEELKVKKQSETMSKELERKASSLRSIERKYYHSYSTIGLPESGPGNGHVLDARDPLAEKKGELASWQRRVEDEMLKHSKAVEVTRAMTLNNIQTGFPGVFQAMTSFSALMTEALETVCVCSYAI